MDDDALLRARLTDAFRIAESGRPHFSGFLDERQAALTAAWARAQGFEGYLLWGGHPEAERVIFGAFPSYMEPQEQEFPISAVTVTYRKEDALSHRDFLGALLSKGVERSTVGDILVEEGRCVLFVRNEVALFLSQQTEKIGRVGVKLSPGFSKPLPAARSFEEFSGVAASARLDCVLAVAVGGGRTAATELIFGGLVMLNHAEALSPSALVKEGAVLSVRGKGRYIIDRLGPPTKKGRLGISGRKCV